MKFDWGVCKQAFTFLAELLEEAGEPPVHLIVSGGSAMQAGQFSHRTTHDVDVLAVKGEVDGGISQAWPLSEALKNAIAEAGVEFGFRPDWVNAATSMLMIPLQDFPEGFFHEMEELEISPDFKVSFLSRRSLIYLKIYAIVGRSEERDRLDLKQLSPTAEERASAITWLEGLELIDEAQRRSLTEAFTEIDHDD